MAALNENFARRPKVFCGDCLKSWAHKSGFDEHFNLKQVKSGEHGGSMIDNPCYNRIKKVMGHTIEEAKSNKKLSQRSFFNISGRDVDAKQETINVKSHIETNEPSVTLQGDENLSNSDSSELMDELKLSDFKDDETQASTSINMNLANVETILNSLLTQQEFLSSQDIKLNEIMPPKMSLMSILKISNQINVQVWLVFSRILLYMVYLR